MRLTLAGLILDRAARLGIWLPALLSVYFFIRAFNLPPVLGPLFLVAAAARWLVRRQSQGRLGAMSDVRASSGFRAEGADLGLLALILILISAPAIRLVSTVGAGPIAQSFLFEDDAYSLLISQALAIDFPPPDLSYYGRTLKYHLGGPLLTEMYFRYGLGNMHTALYGGLALVLTPLAFASLFRIFGLVFPDWSTRRRMICALATGGVFLIHFYNVAWNVRNLLKNGSAGFASVVSGMPVALNLGGFMDPTVYYGQSLAAVLFLVLLANLDRRNPFMLACGLFAMFLAKSSTFVPVGLSWALLALFVAVRSRDYRVFLAGCLALIFSAVASPFILEPGIVKLAWGPGVALDSMANAGRDLAKVLRMERTAAFAAVGAVLLVIGTHVFGVASVRLLDHARHSVSTVGSRVLTLAGLSLVLSIAFPTIFTLRVTPTVQAAFEATHRDIADRLWLPYAGYINEMWKMSLAPAEIVAAYAFGVLAIMGLFMWEAQTQSRVVRRVLVVVVAASLLNVSWRSFDGTFLPPSRTLKIISHSAIEALEAIPLERSVIFTNDCEYDHVQRHLPLMNAWAPAIFGHQFWACNFMYGTYVAADAPERLGRIRWFWDAPIDEERRTFLANAGVSHLLVWRGSDSARWRESELDKTGWAQLLRRNREYSVYGLYFSRAAPEREHE